MANKNLNILSKEDSASFEANLCFKCKEKIEEFYLTLKKRDYFRPKKTAKKFASLLCNGCRSKMVSAVKK